MLFRTSLFLISFLATFFLLATPLAHAEDWTQFRGPTGAGLTSEADLPIEWGGPKNVNILWSAELLGDGIASPIVWKDRLFLINASRKAEDKKIGREYPEQYVASYDINK